MNTLFCLEGIAGAGKTTQVQLCNKAMHGSVVVPELNTRPPLSSAIEQIRRRLAKDHYSVWFLPDEIVQLARARSTVLRETLEKYSKARIILTDRSVYTACAYEAGELRWQEIAEINREANVPFPDHGVILDCDPCTALSRIDERRERQGIYSHRSPLETSPNLTFRRELYLQIARQTPSLRIVNSMRSPERVLATILEYHGDSHG